VTFAIWFTLHSYSLSDKPSDWADFATYFSGMVSPLVAIYVLYYVVRSYRLQKVEFSNASKAMNQQIEIDSLIRRQSSFLELGDKLQDLISDAMSEQVDLKMSKEYDNLIRSRHYPALMKEQLPTLEYILEHLVKHYTRGDYVGGMPPLSCKLNEVIELILQLDNTCTQIMRIDASLTKISENFDSVLSRASTLCYRTRVKDYVDKFKKIEQFADPGFSTLRNF
tara:strand:- start:440 stop:1111 length:672 start_codon:yes stop_codon:yes gene_type:complete